jgi:uncharacterized protein with HEPN domain
VSYRERQRLADIQTAIDAIRSHLRRGGLSDGLVFDAARIRLVEIGEAVKSLPEDLLATQPSIPWRQIARMRDHLAHRYFDTTHAILQATVEEDLPDLERAIHALNQAVGGAAGSYRSLSRSPAWHTMGALRDLDGRRRVERAEFVGIADRHAAHHTVVIDDVLTEPPQRG